jgi:transcriptional adapter 2-alpha
MASLPGGNSAGQIDRGGMRRASSSKEDLLIPGIKSDFADYDGAELLSIAEMRLCEKLRVFPQAYLSIKDLLIKENLAKGGVKKRIVRNLKIDAMKGAEIFDFLIEMGWIRNKKQ